MPVQNVELHGFHSIEIALDDLDRHKVARDINEQAAPGKTGLVVDGKRGQCKYGGQQRYEHNHSQQRTPNVVQHQFTYRSGLQVRFHLLPLRMIMAYAPTPSRSKASEEFSRRAASSGSGLAEATGFRKTGTGTDTAPPSVTVLQPASLLMISAGCSSVTAASLVAGSGMD